MPLLVASHVSSPLVFKKIIFDTSAAQASSGNIAKYLAYCSLMGTFPVIDSKRKALVHFGFVEEEFKGMAQIQLNIYDI